MSLEILCVSSFAEATRSRGGRSNSKPFSAERALAFPPLGSAADGPLACIEGPAMRSRMTPAPDGRCERGGHEAVGT